MAAKTKDRAENRASSLATFRSRYRRQRHHHKIIVFAFCPRFGSTAGRRVERIPFMDLTLEQFGIDRLSPQQRLELIGLIWDSLPEDAPFTPPDWHLRELERRITAAD